jgi:hypothetical protein
MRARSASTESYATTSPWRRINTLVETFSTTSSTCALKQDHLALICKPELLIYSLFLDVGPDFVIRPTNHTPRRFLIH